MIWRILGWLGFDQHHTFPTWRRVAVLRVRGWSFWIGHDW